MWPLRACVRVLTVFWITLAAQAHAEAPFRVVAFGDSLIAGFGLARDEGFVPRLQEAVTGAGHDVVIVNAGVSGDTTSGGLARLEWTLGDGADAMIVELGGNDALRGIDPDRSRANLDAILTTLGERDIPTLLVGMRAPENLGVTYVEPFNAMYADLAAKHDMLLYPYFYEGIADDPQYAQADGIHPSAEGVIVIVDNMLPHVIDLIEQAWVR